VREQYVHVSQVGNTIGGGFGGMKSVRAMHRAVLLEEPVLGDALQEQFINTVAAYVNMLLLSSRFDTQSSVALLHAR
jgi:3-oxoacyl-(acyl-carrier-protein) synthase